MHRLLVSLLCAASASLAQPVTMVYQGYLTDAAHTPVEGSVDMVFRIYDAETDGDLQWDESFELQLSAGQFSVVLGESSPLDEGIFAGSGERWLSVEVFGRGELSPRQAIGSVPWALICGEAQSIAGFTVDDLQERVEGTCDPGNAIREIAANGTVTCEPVAGGGGGGSGDDLYTDGNAWIEGMLRLGSEEGTGEAPIYPPSPPEAPGLIIRRVTSNIFPNDGVVIARTDDMTMERDGTLDGMQIRNSGTTERIVVCHWVNDTNAPGSQALRVSPGPEAILWDADAAVMSVTCQFGDPVGLGHVTTVELLHSPGQAAWVGHLVSTYNQ